MWWRELSDAELRARLVNRNFPEDGARDIVTHMRRGCLLCHRIIAGALR